MRAPTTDACTSRGTGASAGPSCPFARSPGCPKALGFPDWSRRAIAKVACTPCGTTIETATSATTCTARTTTGKRGRPWRATFPRSASCAPCARTRATNPSCTWAPRSACSTAWTAARAGRSCAAACRRRRSTTWSCIPGTTTWCWARTAEASGYWTRSTRFRSCLPKSSRPTRTCSRWSRRCSGDAPAEGSTPAMCTIGARTRPWAPCSTIGSPARPTAGRWRWWWKRTVGRWPRWRAASARA